MFTYVHDEQVGNTLVESMNHTKKHSESAETISDIQHLCYHLCLFREVYKIIKA